MRLDDYLSTIGLVKRRTQAKELAQNGMVLVGDRAAKPAYQVKVRDIIRIKGKRSITAEVLDIPTGSVSKPERTRYYRELPSE
jgi:ribosome-associated heat shock protein Hsp15